jgi:hypothetical protein
VRPPSSARIRRRSGSAYRTRCGMSGTRNRPLGLRPSGPCCHERPVVRSNRRTGNGHETLVVPRVAVLPRRSRRPDRDDDRHVSVGRPTVRRRGRDRTHLTDGARTDAAPERSPHMSRQHPILARLRPTTHEPPTPHTRQAATHRGGLRGGRSAARPHLVAPTAGRAAARRPAAHAAIAPNERRLLRLQPLTRKLVAPLFALGTAGLHSPRRPCRTARPTPCPAR